MTINNDLQPKPKCTVIKGKNASTKTEIIPEEEALKHNPEDFDISVDRVRMKVFIKLANGKTKKFNGPIKKVDGKPLGLLKKLMMRPDRYLSSYDIGNLGEYDESYFIKDNIIPYTAKLRKYLFSGDKQRFIKTASRPYRIALSGDISFCWIEPYSEVNEKE